MTDEQFRYIHRQLRNICIYLAVIFWVCVATLCRADDPEVINYGEGNSGSLYLKNDPKYTPGYFTVDNFYTSPIVSIGNIATPASTSIQFGSSAPDYKIIGKLTWDKGVFKFEGNAEESAKLFFNYVIKLGLEEYIKQEVKCAKDK